MYFDGWRLTSICWQLTSCEYVMCMNFVCWRWTAVCWQLTSSERVYFVSWQLTAACWHFTSSERVYFVCSQMTAVCWHFTISEHVYFVCWQLTEACWQLTSSVVCISFIDSWQQIVDTWQAVSTNWVLLFTLSCRACAWQAPYRNFNIFFSLTLPFLFLNIGRGFLCLFPMLPNISCPLASLQQVTTNVGYLIQSDNNDSLQSWFANHFQINPA